MSSNHFILSSILLLYNLLQTQSQQPYVNNHQLNCPINHPTTLGFTCNSPTPSCQSYLTFRTTPTYNSPVSISYLLSSNPTQIAALNNISTVDPLPIDTLLIIPVNCSCTPLRTYYQHNSSYVLQHSGETYFTVANNTYQSLSTCQSMEAQNSYGIRDLVPNLTLNVPLRCACPTENQTAAGFNYLLTYLVRQGNTVTYIADYFSGAGATVQGILDANELNETQLIYFFTPLLVPLTREPVIENIRIGALPPVVSPPPPSAPDTPSGEGNSRRWIFVGVGVGVAVLVLFSCGVLVWIVLRNRRKGERIPPTPPKVFNSGKKEKEDMSVEVPVSDWSISSEGIRSAVETLTLYKFEELEKATDWFSEGNRIGESAVYVGTFNGDYAAVKIMKGDVSREIDVLRQIIHLHIVRLSGFCLHQGVTYLVYEYAKNGALADWLSLSGSSKVKGFGVVRGDRGLDWKERVQIAYDVADALNYLHNFANPPYIHKNLKSSNVLLDSNLRAKVSNFGLARSLENEDEEQGGALTRHVVGTYGYMAPEYIENGLVTPKLDVFALGVVILELLSGKEAVMSEKGGELLFESIEGVMSGENVREKFRQFVDPWLGEDYPLELAYSLAELAKRCVAHDLNARPSVSEVVMALSRLLSSSLDWNPSHEQRSTSFSRGGR